VKGKGTKQLPAVKKRRVTVDAVDWHQEDFEVINGVLREKLL
jgi:hypothetical protein